MESLNSVKKNKIQAIGVQLCNRLDYAKCCLDSLATQANFDFATCRIVIIVDKALNAVVKSQISHDNRDEIIAYARNLFPEAEFILPDRNLGIGNSFLELQLRTFEGLEDSDWAFFIEEDIVLEENHLSNVQKLISSLKENEKVQKVSLFQGVFDYLEAVPFGDISMSEGTKCFAESKLLHKIVSPRLQQALAYFKDYEGHKKEDRFSRLLLIGLHVPFYLPSKDFIVDECIAQSGYICLLWNIGMAKDIGVIGEGGSVWTGAINTPESLSEVEKVSVENLSLKVMYSLPKIVDIQSRVRLQRAKITQEALYDSMSILKTLRRLRKLLFFRVFKAKH